MNISKYILVVLSVAVVMPSISRAMDHNAQADQKDKEAKAQAEQKSEHAQGSTTRLANSAQEFAQAAQELRQRREAAQKLNINNNQIPWKKVALNALSISAGFLAGRILKSLGEEIEKKKTASPGLSVIVLGLMAAPFLFAEEVGAYKTLTGIALLGGAQL